MASRNKGHQLSEIGWGKNLHTELVKHLLWLKGIYTLLLEVCVCVYLACEDATEANDDQDIKDSWSHNCPHTHISLCDKHP